MPSKFMTVPTAQANFGSVLAALQALTHDMNLLIVNAQSQAQSPNLTGANVFSKTDGSGFVVGTGSGAGTGGSSSGGTSVAATGYAHFAGTQSGMVKSGNGTCFGFTSNKEASGDTLTLYDGIDQHGTIIGVFDLASHTGPWAFPGGGIRFNVGLFVVLSGSADVTVCWS